VAPNVTIMPIKAFTPYGLTNSATLYSSFEYAIAAGARVIVTGWGTRRYSKALEDAIRVAQANGVLVVAAAGDGGEDLEKHPYFPASLSPQFSNLITVAGYAPEGTLTRAYGLYSNYGRVVDLAAPGANIEVANPREQYKKRSHTGLAAGIVAGAAGLIWSRCPGLEPSQVKDILLSSSTHLESLRGEVPENRVLSLSQALDKTNQVCK
jgi:subtilisin family serine protease